MSIATSSEKVIVRKKTRRLYDEEGVIYEMTWYGNDATTNLYDASGKRIGKTIGRLSEKSWMKLWNWLKKTCSLLVAKLPDKFRTKKWVVGSVCVAGLLLMVAALTTYAIAKSKNDFIPNTARNTHVNPVNSPPNGVQLDFSVNVQKGNAYTNFADVHVLNVVVKGKITDSTEVLTLVLEDSEGRFETLAQGIDHTHLDTRGKYEINTRLNPERVGKFFLVLKDSLTERIIEKKILPGS